MTGRVYASTVCRCNGGLESSSVESSARGYVLGVREAAFADNSDCHPKCLGVVLHCNTTAIGAAPGLLQAAPGCCWLLLAAAGCSWPGCCWLLLAVALAAPGCSWLLLAARGCSGLLLAALGCWCSLSFGFSRVVASRPDTSEDKVLYP